MIIKICGSSNFKDEIMEQARKLTLEDHIVLVPTIFEHQEEDLPTEVKLRLGNIQKQKINMSDAIFVVNVDGYIGEGTFSDIDWALRNNKKVFFLIDPNKEDENEKEKSNDETVD